jgi:hypothetical protein
MKLQQRIRHARQRAFDGGRDRVDEQQNRRDERRQRIREIRQRVGRNEARARRIADETDRIGAGFDGCRHVGHAGQAADLDARAGHASGARSSAGGSSKTES